MGKSGIRAEHCFRGRRSLSDLKKDLIQKLIELRAQGMVIADINPISALADDLSHRLYRGAIDLKDISALIQQLEKEVWSDQVQSLRVRSGMALRDQLDSTDISEMISNIDVSRPFYGAVFTAHPVFAMRAKSTENLAKEAVEGTNQFGTEAFSPRIGITLNDEHSEAIGAMKNARLAIREINREILLNMGGNKVVPQMLSVSTWVGYDLDGRDDISWVDSFLIRLKEKRIALEIYIEACSGYEILEDICEKLKNEHAATVNDIENFKGAIKNKRLLSKACNNLTERTEKIISSKKLAEEIEIVAASILDENVRCDVLTIASDVKSHGFGIGEVHLRINSVQIRNAMRSIDKRSVVTSGDHVPDLVLMERLSKRIETEKPWTINFGSIEDESAVARRQLMLARQILKHVDADQPIRFLIAECEKPITVLSALYLAHKLDIADHLDISPLFETDYGIESGGEIIKTLLQMPVYRSYLKSRGRMAIQIGFSDSGRFVGQIAAAISIEKLQISIIGALNEILGTSIDLIIFNTHGESKGRGGNPDSPEKRQGFIMTPHVRAMCLDMGMRVFHQSSFQGGDGYRLFKNQTIAWESLRHIFLAELSLSKKSSAGDPFYKNKNFAGDLLTATRAWHRELVNDPDYTALLDIFGTNLLTTSGSRPSKRVFQPGVQRSDPSKIRAISHNGILQQLGFSANVISGLGTAAELEIGLFETFFPHSQRLQQLLTFALSAKYHGSINTLAAYGRILDPNLWIGRAYHDFQPDNLRSFRRISSLLGGSRSAEAVHRLVGKFRDDLIQLYRVSKRTKKEDARTQDSDRVLLDLIHAIRIFILTETLVLFAKVPKFAESSKYSADQSLEMALTLDFSGAVDIIKDEFSSHSKVGTTLKLSETENYRRSLDPIYLDIEDQLINPIIESQSYLERLSLMISSVHDAHG